MFENARLKLTSWYLAIIMLISISFSFAIFRLISIEINRFAQIQRFRIERQWGREMKPPPPLEDPELINEAEHRILITLIFINGFILITAGSVGYFLAGKTLNPIKKMLDGQKRFVSDSSHEFRTPLTSLKCLLEVALRDKKLNLNEAKKAIEGSVDEVKKLESLSNSLLELASYQDEPLDLSMAKTSISDCVDLSLENLKYQVRKNNMEIIVEGKDVNTKVNKEDITKLLVLLLDNAIKYSHSDSKIIVSTKRSGMFLEIEVKDFGIGISKENLPHIFERFYRADSARTKEGRNGYGLGLAIAKRIVEKHKGSIKVEGELGKGSSFLVFLPT